MRLFPNWLFGASSPALGEQVQLDAPVDLSNPVGSVARACIDRIVARLCHIQFKSSNMTPNRPAGAQCSRDFYTKIAEDVLIEGYALAYKNEEGFWQAAIAQGSQYRHEERKGEGGVWWLKVGIAGGRYQGRRMDYITTPERNVLFITRRPLQGRDIYIPATPLREINDAMVLYERARAHQTDYSDRGNKIGYVLQGVKEVQNKKSFTNQRNDLKRRLNEGKGRNYGTYSSPLETELRALGGPNAPEKGSYEYATMEVARHFGVPLQMLQTDAAPTTDEERVESRLLNDGVFPIAERIAAAWEKTLKTPVEVQPLSMSQPTLGARAAHITALARTGCVTINELRELLGKEPIKGGDKFPEVVGGAERNKDGPGRPGENAGGNER